MKGLFVGEQTALEQALDYTAASLNAWGETHRHWRVAYSGGKDSTATLIAVAYLIETGRVPRPQTLGCLYADTRMELPNLQAAAMGLLDAVRARGWSVDVVLPRLDKRFFVMMLGRGVPPSHSGFRWCTGALKVDPMAVAMEAYQRQYGEKMLLLTGLRIGESANRDKRITLACGRNGGECGSGWYHETGPADVADILAPLLHWRTCHVWDWLVLHRKQHGFDASAVAEVYDQDEQGSALDVLSRTGCLVCPVASRDYALERSLTRPEWAYLAPLLRLRQVYDELTSLKSRIRKVGERTASGELSSRPMRTGPLTMPARCWGLEQVLAIQDAVNVEARALGRPEVSLINAEEHMRILELIEANTWPQGWDGDEPAADLLLDEVRRDGSVQKALWEAKDA